MCVINVKSIISRDRNDDVWCVYVAADLKTFSFFVVFFDFFIFIFDFFLYIYIRCRKFNAEFNKLIKTIGHRARFFEKWCWTHPHDVVHCYTFWNNCSIESSYFFYEKRHTYCLSKQAKKVYVTILLLILYSIWVHVVSPEYKMICLNSPKSIWFAIFSPTLGPRILNYLNFSSSSSSLYFLLI